MELRVFLRGLFISFFALIGAFVFVSSHQAEAAYMSYMTDLISWSVPSATSTHDIRFYIPNAVPPSGQIELYHDDGALNVPVGLSFADVDLGTSGSFTGPYVDRTLAATANAALDGVTVVSGSSPGSGITLTLNSTTGISAGQYIEIKIGTNASFGGAGTTDLVNPSTPGSYHLRMRTKTAGGTIIDEGSTVFVIITPVQLGPVDTTDVIPPVRSNGMPSGQLPASTAAVEFALNTNKLAYCRYDTASGTAYELMPSLFTKTQNTLHTQVVAVAQGTSYNFFVRCSGIQNGAATNTDDYIITFSIGTTASTSATSTPSPTPSPGPGNATSQGSGIGGGNYLGQANVTFSGRAYPLAPLTIFRDGKIESQIQAAIDGRFEQTLYGFDRGAYTFSIGAQDTGGRKSATYSSTIYLIANTNNLVGPIYVSPTIALEKSTLDPGESVVVKGSAIPLSVVEVFMEKQNAKGEGSIVTGNATSSATGVWTASLPTEGLSNGTYAVKANSIVGKDKTNFSPIVYAGIGEAPAPDFSLRADLNKDKKVNLVDFSILLFNWKTADAVADINQDGDVNLTDFSILVFYWTG